MAYQSTNPWANLPLGATSTQVQQDAAAGRSFLLIWIHELRIFAPFTDTPEGLAAAQACLVEQWNSLHVPVTTTETTITRLERSFCIKRVQPGATGDEVVCTLHDGIIRSAQ